MAAQGLHEPGQVGGLGQCRPQALRHRTRRQRSLDSRFVHQPVGQRRFAGKSIADEVAGRDHASQGLAQLGRSAFEFRQDARFADARQLLLREVGKFRGHGGGEYWKCHLRTAPGGLRFPP